MDYDYSVIFSNTVMESRVHITISLPVTMAQRLQKEQAARGFTRSEFFRFMIRRQFEEFDLARLADAGGAFDFLASEPELYSLPDTKP